MIGRTLGHYRVIEKLGEGGMGVVYCAKDEELPREVALKLLSADLLNDPVARARLLREARAAASLNHPNICKVYEVDEADGQAFIAMELVGGRTLSSVVESGPLSPKQVVRYGLQVSDAIAHAHERGIVHRDLKSLNVIVTPEGHCKVLDFGLARRIQGTREATVQTVLTEAGTLIGTPAYMAPEQLNGETVDERSDVWALGVMLYEMAAGRLPFTGNTYFEVSAAILNEKAPRLPAHVAVSLTVVIERCLEKDPRKRYPNARAVLSELKSIEDGETTTLSAWSRRLRRRPRLLVAAAVATVLLGVVALNPGSLQERVAEWISPRIESVAVLPLENLSGDPSQDYLSDGITDSLITELSKFGTLKSVVGRGSVMRYKGTQKTREEIASELKVQSLILGSVSRLLNQITVKVSLIHPKDGRVLWGGEFKGDLKNILQLQNEIIKGVTRQMRLEMRPEDLKRLQQVRTVNPDAYEATLKGMVSWYKHTQEDIEDAQKYFQRALELDPEYAPAYGGLMWVWVYLGSATVPPSEVLAGMDEFNRKMQEQGVVFDETQAEAYEANADGQFYYAWNWSEAEKNYKKALELKPNSAELRLFYWDFLAAMDRKPEARAMLKRALELDPYNAFAHTSYGLFLLVDHDFDGAIAQFQKMLDQKLDFGLSHFGLWTAYHHKGMFREALEEAKTSFNEPLINELVDQAYKDDGYPGAMIQIAEIMISLQPKVYFLPTNIARQYAYAGEKEKALEYLEKALADRDSGLAHLQVDPDWDTLRQEPRFQALMKAMKFPD